MSSTATPLTYFANAIRAVLDLDPLPELGKRKIKTDEERFYREPVCWSSLEMYGSPTPVRGRGRG